MSDVDPGALGALTDDLMLGGRLRLMQPRQGLRATIDPVLLAAAIAAAPGERVLELGSGSGVAALCLAARVSGCCVTGLEQDAALAALAERNAALNGMADRVDFLAGAVETPPAALVAGGFDHVMANPPYLPAGQGSLSPFRSKARAVGEGTAALDLWLDLAFRLVRPGGSVSFIQRADRLGELLRGMAGGGATLVLPLWPRAGAAATRVIVRSLRGRRTPLAILPGLVLHEADGRYSAAADAVLRDAAALEIAGSTGVSTIDSTRVAQ